MVFSSALFIFLFFPLTLVLSFITPSKWKNALLLIVSLLFYSWGEPIYVSLMIVSIIINYFVGLQLQGAYRSIFLALGITLNLSFIGYFKYFEFFHTSLASITSIPTIEMGSVHLPIGISFFTFQAISYLLDVYRKETEPQQKFISLALYISLFPQLIAGPIVRYRDINEQLLRRSVSIKSFTAGVERFSIGLIKKVIIANNMALLADGIFNSNQLDSPIAWLGILAYSFQIYYDFSGYSDMAIGLGKMFGFTFLENFNYPYISKSIREFWRRWHISLSSWFRDYLYVPLGGNQKGNTRTYFNLLVVFFLTGLWHGASWNFIIWGLFHGFFLTLERIITPVFPFKLPSVLYHIYTLLIVLVGWVFFRIENIDEGLSYIHAMFSFSLSPDWFDKIKYMVNKEIMWVLILAVTFSMPIKKIALQKLSLIKNDNIALTGLGFYRLLIILFLLVSVSYIAADTYNPFIYFRF